MKQRILSSAQTILDDRQLTTLLGVFLASCVAVLVYLALSIHSSELQVVIHYTSFGSTNFYRDRWFYLLLLPVFVVFLAISHTCLVYRLLIARGRQFALAFLWLSIILLFIAVSLFYQILKVASLS